MNSDSGNTELKKNRRPLSTCFRIPIACVSLNFDLVISSPPPTFFFDRKLYFCLVLFYGRLTGAMLTVSRTRLIALLRGAPVTCSLPGCGNAL